VETGVPQGSPVAPILFTGYLSGCSTTWKAHAQAGTFICGQCGMVGGGKVGKISFEDAEQGDGSNARLGGGK